MQEEPSAPMPMTRKQKLAHFWYYYKWHVLGFSIVFLLLFFFIRDIVTRVEPDYTISILSYESVAPDLFEPLGEALSAVADDVNQDGKTIVQISHYNLSKDDPISLMSSQTRLAANFQTMESFIFFTDSPEKTQTDFSLFAPFDSLEIETTEPANRVTFPYAESSLLTKLILNEKEQENSLEKLLQNYEIGIRTPPKDFKNDMQKQRFEQELAFFRKLVKK